MPEVKPRPLYEPHDFQGREGVLGGNCTICCGPITEPWHNLDFDMKRKCLP